MDVDDAKYGPYHCPSSFPVTQRLCSADAPHRTQRELIPQGKIVQDCEPPLVAYVACHIWPPCAVCLNITRPPSKPPPKPPSKPPMPETDIPLDPYEQRAGSYLMYVASLLSSPVHIRATNLGSVSSLTVVNQHRLFPAPVSRPRSSPATTSRT